MSEKMEKDQAQEAGKTRTLRRSFLQLSTWAIQILEKMGNQ